MKINTTVYDVASYVLQKKKTVTAMKLQKLVYYCQAWSLVWEDSPIFNEKIEAWVNGPISPDLFKAHKGRYEVSSLSQGDPDSLEDNQKETVDAVLNYYASHKAQWLSDLTHLEDPWKDARKDVPRGKPSNNEITHASMSEYYFSLPPES